MRVPTSLKSMAATIVKSTANADVEPLQNKILSRLNKRELIKALVSEMQLKNNYISKCLELSKQLSLQ